MTTTRERIAELGWQLPKPRTTSVAHIEKAVRTGDLLFVSGHGPRDTDGNVVYSGKVGGSLSEAEAVEAARLCVLGCLTTVEQAVGDLDRVTRVVKALGYIASDPSFVRQPFVMNGASDALLEIFGERGRHARSAIGVAVIPHDMAMEVELIVEVS